MGTEGVLTVLPFLSDAQGPWTWTKWQMSGNGRLWRVLSATSGRHPVSC